MTHGNMARGLRRAIMVGAMHSLALLFSDPGWADGPPEGLPKTPEMPDFYDPAVVDTYTLIAKRPYQVNGQPLAPWLLATVLTPKAVHVGPPSVAHTANAAGGAKDVILVIGYVTDTRDGRIIALTETFGHPGDETRTVKAWVDEGWVTKGKGSGEWGREIRSETALTPQQTAAFMGQVYSLIQTGFEQSIKR